MTKAERIFQKTRWMCKNGMETFGYAVNPDGKAVGYNTTAHEDNECIYKETLTAMERILASQRKMLEMDKKLKIVDEEKYTKESQILNMVETTIQNARESIENR